MNRNIIITGANGGLGRAMIEKFSESKDNIWACIRNETGEFRDYIEEKMLKYKIWIRPICMDMLSSESIKEGYKKICYDKKNVDVLINNAGVGHMSLFQMTSMEEIRKIYDVNLFSTMQLTQYVLRNMIRQRNGSIINISSTAGSEVYVGNSIYGGTKAAVNMYTKALAAEVFHYGINVNAVAPGLVDTKMSRIFEGKDPNKPISHTALERKIQPNEIAEVIYWLLEDKTKIVNGEVINVTGGHK